MLSYNRIPSIEIFRLFRDRHTTEITEELAKTSSATTMKRQTFGILEKLSAHQS